MTKVVGRKERDVATHIVRDDEREINASDASLCVALCFELGLFLTSNCRIHTGYWMVWVTCSGGRGGGDRLAVRVGAGESYQVVSRGTKLHL